MQVAEHAHPGLLLREQQSAKVAGELLDAGAHGNKIVVGPKIRQLLFKKRFLQSNVSIVARSAFAHVNIHDALLPGPKLVDVEGRAVAGSASTVTSSPSDSATARSMRFSSSRTLPGNQ